MGGLTNRTLRRQMAVLWSPDYSQSQASYDLCRRRHKGFIERVTRTNTCRVTAHGRRMATIFTSWPTGSSFPASPSWRYSSGHRGRTPQPVRDAWRAYERTVDALVRKRLAA